MSQPSSGPDPEPDSTRTSNTPSGGPVKTIGPYRLLQRIGEGGMGEVWMAEQLTPMRRMVAVKIIKAGMDTGMVIARFEAERQALAMMDHPVIAKVFDGGATPEGRPYFAMEYVKGEPITTYCDRYRLSTTARLELFIQVCEGVQHAHQKGVIHRDLKPSNILVTLADEHPAPKVIDFGVAKAITQSPDRSDVVHGGRRPDRYARVHESRAGGSDRTRHRHQDRCLCAWGAAVRVADGDVALRSAIAATARTGRDPPCH